MDRKPFGTAPHRQPGALRFDGHGLRLATTEPVPALPQPGLLARWWERLRASPPRSRTSGS